MILLTVSALDLELDRLGFDIARFFCFGIESIPEFGNGR